MVSKYTNLMRINKENVFHALSLKALVPFHCLDFDMKFSYIIEVFFYSVIYPYPY